MKAPTHKPWLEPGHRFSIDWPPGFVSKTGPAPTIDYQAVAARSRQTALSRGITGTVNGRDAGTVRAKSGDPAKAQVR